VNVHPVKRAVFFYLYKANNHCLQFDNRGIIMKAIVWIGILSGGMLLLTAQFAMSRDKEDGMTWTRLASSDEPRGIAPVTNRLYEQECGACHFAYQPGLLPAQSWKKTLNNLSDHFGETVELEKGDLAALTEYITKNAADQSGNKFAISGKIIRSLGDREIPARITEVPYIVRQHHELSARHIGKNPDVKSLSNCNACHTRAETGSFREGQVVIPNFGQWED